METSIRIVDYHLEERIKVQNAKIMLSVNHHQFILASNKVLSLNIAKHHPN